MTRSEWIRAVLALLIVSPIFLRAWTHLTPIEFLPLAALGLFVIAGFDKKIIAVAKWLKD